MPYSDTCTGRFLRSIDRAERTGTRNPADDLLLLVGLAEQALAGGERGLALNVLGDVRAVVKTMRSVLDINLDKQRRQVLDHLTHCRDYAEMQLTVAKLLAERGSNDIKAIIPKLEAELGHWQKQVDELTFTTIGDLDPDGH